MTPAPPEIILVRDEDGGVYVPFAVTVVHDGLVLADVESSGYYHSLQDALRAVGVKEQADDTPKDGTCFSRSGWWQTLCGLDAANQGFGWTSTPTEVGCTDCQRLIKNDEHLKWGDRYILKRMRRKGYDD